MFQHNFSPHFHSLPFSESIEEFQIFYLFVVLFFSHPFFQFYKLGGFPIDIVTKTLFADCIITGVKLLLYLFVALILHNVKFVWILLIILGSIFIFGVDQVQKLLQILLSFESSRDVLVQSHFL